MLPSHWFVQKLSSDTYEANVLPTNLSSRLQPMPRLLRDVRAARLRLRGTPGGLRNTEKCASLLRASLHAHTYTRTVKAESFGLSAHFHGVRGIACTRQESTRWWLLLVWGSGRLVSQPEQVPGVDRLVGRPPVRLLGVAEDFAAPFRGTTHVRRASGGCGDGADGEGS